MTDKQIIKTFSDGYCLVLHENRISLQENNYTKYQIVVGAKTNELFEFVKELYLDNKAKEQECEELRNFHINLVGVKECDIKELPKFKQTLIEIKEIAKKAKKDICNNCAWRSTDSCDPENYTCGEFIKILQKINEVLDD